MSNESNTRNRGDDPETQTSTDSRGDAGGQSEDATGPTAVQKAVILVSATVTVLLFAYAGWQIAAAPQADVPEVSVVGTESLADGSLAVRVRLENPRDLGLVTATIESVCSSPPVQVQLSYVPASSSRTATLVCPAGTTDPEVALVNWVTQ